MTRILIALAVLFWALPVDAQRTQRVYAASAGTWYVDNVNGVDGWGCGQPSPCKTIQFTINYLVDNFDFAGQPTIQLATTGVPYAEAVILPRWSGSLGWRSAGNYTYPVIQGDQMDNTAVKVLPPSGSAFTSVHGSPWIISSLTVAAPQYGIVSDAGSHLLLQNINFYICGNGHMVAEYGGFIETIAGGYTISGSAPYHITAVMHGIFVSQGNAVTLVGNPNFVYFADGGSGGLVATGGISYASGILTSYHPGQVNNDGTALMYPNSNGNWP
jgi:hypothetical protein